MPLCPLVLMFSVIFDKTKHTQDLTLARRHSSKADDIQKSSRIFILVL